MMVVVLCCDVAGICRMGCIVCGVGGVGIAVDRDIGGVGVVCVCVYVVVATGVVVYVAVDTAGVGDAGTVGVGMVDIGVVTTGIYGGDVGYDDGVVVWVLLLFTCRGGGCGCW